MMRKKLFSALVLSIFLTLQLSSASAAPLASVAGKVTVGSEKTPMSGVRVLAWPVDSPTLAEETPHTSSPSTADGLFQLQLPPGAYYFIAEGNELYCFYGRNPVTVPESGIEGMNLSLVKRQPPSPPWAPQVDTGVLGQLTFEGKPLAGAVLQIYTDLNTQLKGMGLGMTAPSDANGYVEAPLPPGTYYLVARKRSSGSFAGPLQVGDFFGYYADNPLVVKEGEVAKIPIAMVEVPEKVARLADTLFGQTSIGGRILDAGGSPVSGVRVLLYPDPMMLNRPLYVSQPSMADGRFVLSFPEGGVYYLAARNNLGGAPAPGELYGRISGSRDSSVRVRTGQALQGVELVVEMME